MGVLNRFGRLFHLEATCCFEGQQSEIASLPVFKASSTDRHVFTVSSNEQKQGLMVNSHQNGEADMVFQLAGFPVKK